MTAKKGPADEKTIEEAKAKRGKRKLTVTPGATNMQLKQPELVQRIQDIAADYYPKKEILDVLNAYGEVALNAVLEGYAVPLYGVGRIYAKRTPPRPYSVYGGKTGMVPSYVRPCFRFGEKFRLTLKKETAVDPDEYDDFLAQCTEDIEVREAAKAAKYAKARANKAAREAEAAMTAETEEDPDDE